MAESVAFGAFVTILMGGLAVLTLGMVAVAVVLRKRNRTRE